MSRAQRWWLWTTAVLSAASGLAYAYMRYWLDNDDPFSAFNHPAQPWALDLHLLVSPALLFTVGWLWGNHVVPKLRRGRGTARTSGLTLLVPVALMTATGYLLQTASAPGWRSGLGWAHGLSGVIFLVLMFGHGLTGRNGYAESRRRFRDEGADPIVETSPEDFAAARLQPAQDDCRNRRTARRAR